MDQTTSSGVLLQHNNGAIETKTEHGNRVYGFRLSHKWSRGKGEAECWDILDDNGAPEMRRFQFAKFVLTYLTQRIKLLNLDGQRNKGIVQTLMPHVHVDNGSANRIQEYVECE